MLDLNFSILAVTVQENNGTVVGHPQDCHVIIANYQGQNVEVLVRRRFCETVVVVRILETDIHSERLGKDEQSAQTAICDGVVECENACLLSRIRTISKTSTKRGVEVDTSAPPACSYR